MSGKRRSEPNVFGGCTNYDDKGKRSGRTEPNLFGGGYTTYDSKGKKVGRSEPNLFGGGYTHYDAKGKKIGSSEPGLFGGYTNYDAKGKKTGTSNPGAFGSYKHNNSADACYIATCVYGSYDAPEVRILRRFRDETLKQRALGRAFIRCYYAVSPRLVKWFGKKQWFHRFWRKRLDRMVAQFRENAKETPEA